MVRAQKWNKNTRKWEDSDCDCSSGNCCMAFCCPCFVVQSNMREAGMPQEKVQEAFLVTLLIAVLSWSGGYGTGLIPVAMGCAIMYYREAMAKTLGANAETLGLNWETFCAVCCSTCSLMADTRSVRKLNTGEQCGAPIYAVPQGYAAVPQQAPAVVIQAPQHGVPVPQEGARQAYSDKV